MLRKGLKYSSFFFMIMLLCTCKKKTHFDVLFYNPLLDEPVTGATTVLVERKGFGPKADCNELAECVTDENGLALYDEEKLRKSTSFSYYVTLKNAYGKDLTYPCAGYDKDYISKGESKSYRKIYWAEGTIVMRHNNIFNPAINGDSVNVKVERYNPYVPELGYYALGSSSDGIGALVATYNPTSMPYPVVMDFTTKLISGKIFIRTYKKKMGVVTISYDTTKFYPNQTTIVNINW